MQQRQQSSQLHPAADEEKMPPARGGPAAPRGHDSCEATQVAHCLKRIEGCALSHVLQPS